MGVLNRPLRLTFIAGDNSGPAYHDIFVPTIFFHKYNLLEVKFLQALDYSSLHNADLIVMQRQYAPESYFSLHQLLLKGKIGVFICDDNVWEVPPGNPAKATYETPDIMYRYLSVMNDCYAVTTSTPYLRELCLQQNPRVYLFRNLVDPMIETYLSPGRDNPEEVRIGWFGTPHHHDDIVLIEDALATIGKKYPQVKWVFMGYQPPNLITKFRKGSYERYMFVQVDAFYPSLASLDFDIGIVPLVDNGFNRGKTCRKFQEHSILRIPTVASLVGEYRRLPGDTIMRVESNKRDEWIRMLSYLIENPEARTRLGTKAHDYIIDKHDINTYIYERAAVYYKIYRDAKKEDIDVPEGCKPFMNSEFNTTDA